jgi:hypothetical protein
MKTFKEFFKQYALQLVSESEANDSALNFIKKWRDKVKVLSAAGDESGALREHVMSQSDIAYGKLYRFHFLEYKLHLLKQNGNTGNLTDFTIYEINNLYEWLKEWMLGILETRVYYDTDKNPRYLNWWNELQQKATIPERERHVGSGIGGKEMGIPWESIVESYIRLKSASSLKDKVIAITLALNAWHDNGGIFGITSQDAEKFGGEDVWSFAPLSMAQFDKLDKIDPRKVEQEIRKELN